MLPYSKIIIKYKIKFLSNHVFLFAKYYTGHPLKGIDSKKETGLDSIDADIDSNGNGRQGQEIAMGDSGRR